MNITPKQRKALLICAGVIVGSYVVRSGIDSAREAAVYRQQAANIARQRAEARAHPKAQTRATPEPFPPAIQEPASNPVQASPAVPTPVPPPSTPVPAPIPPKPAPSPLSGVWRGNAALEGRGICALMMELHEKEPGHFTGFSTLRCGNFGPLMAKEDRNLASATLNRLAPAAEIVSGAMENGALQLTVDKVVTTNSNGCAATSFTLTPFSNQLAAEWREGTCQGGSILLARARQ